MGNIELFDQIADQYDSDDRVQVAKAIVAAIRRHVGNAIEKSALDYGCGTGLVGLELADAFASMLLVDASQQMVRQVLGKIETAGLRTAHAICCDITAENPPELHADYVILAQVLLHIPDVPFILSRLRELLNEGGHLLIVDFDKNEQVVSDRVHNGFDQAELIRLCKAAGFTSANAQTFYHGKNMLMGKDASLFLLDAVR